MILYPLLDRKNTQNAQLPVGLQDPSSEACAMTSGTPSPFKSMSLTRVSFAVSRSSLAEAASPILRLDRSWTTRASMRLLRWSRVRAFVTSIRSCPLSSWMFLAFQGNGSLRRFRDRGGLISVLKSASADEKGNCQNGINHRYDSTSAIRAQWFAQQFGWQRIRPGRRVLGKRRGERLQFKVSWRK